MGRASRTGQTKLDTGFGACSCGSVSTQANQPEPTGAATAVFFRAMDDAFRKFGRAPFYMRHHLTDNPLFALSRLQRLAEQMETRSPRGTETDAALTIRANRPDMPNPSPSEAFAAIEAGDGPFWIKLSSVDKVDPDYDTVLQQALCEVGVELARIRIAPAQVTWSALTVFVAAPGVETPFHNDHEQNLLLQLRGEKRVQLYDRRIIPPDTIERFYMGDPVAARYRQDYAGTGSEYLIGPGDALHYPMLWPHAVVNGGELSISVSIAFSTRPMDDYGRICQINRLIRGVGFRQSLPSSPLTPGDRAKAWLGRMLSARPRRTHEDLFFVSQLRKEVRRHLSGSGPA